MTLLSDTDFREAVYSILVNKNVPLYENDIVRAIAQQYYTDKYITHEDFLWTKVKNTLLSLRNDGFVFNNPIIPNLWAAFDMNSHLYESDQTQTQFHHQPAQPTARDFLDQANQIMEQRAQDYDSSQGERSIPAAVEAFNHITGDGRMDSAERGWLFMEILKMVRSQQGEYKQDNYVDGVAYSALRAEAAKQERS